MRVAALYDIHGNLPALEAVLADLEREPVDTIVVGGDVLWGPFQSECISLLLDAGSLFLSGNCERDVLAGTNDGGRTQPVEATAAWCQQQLEPSIQKLVRGWPGTIELDVEGLGRVLFCHATPRSDEEILTRQTPDGDVVAALAGVHADVVVNGHTHVQDDRELPGAPRLVNAGSVGLPYQGRRGAHWAILGPEVDLRRTLYDVETALESLCTSGFPSVEEIFSESLRGEVTAESATAHFEAKRLGA